MTASAGPAPGILLILDGWGHAPASPVNALAAAHTPVLDKLLGTFPSVLLAASGEAVGLPPQTVGNSEIGHLVIGAGRPLPYDSLLVQQQIDSGQLSRNGPLIAACRRLADSGGAMHLIGLCSDGQIHAHTGHLGELLAVIAGQGVPRVRVHVIADGRDVADGTAAFFLRQVREFTTRAGTGRIATVTGRGYAMDKSGDLTLTARAALAIADGQGVRVSEPEQALSGADSDEWVPPSTVTDAAGQPSGVIASGDTVLFFNFRSDRIQQLADFLTGHLLDTGRDVPVLSLAQYDTHHPIEPLVRRADASGGLSRELDSHGLRSVRIAEPEKFEHVTYYLNGRDGARHATQEHLRIGDGARHDYRAHPQMRISQVAHAVTAASRRRDVALVIANLANIDVVGHTGDLPATIRAAEHTDHAVAAILSAAAADGRWAVLVGDHGNAELMARPAADGTVRPYGGHTTNPVPAVIVPPQGRRLSPVAAGTRTLADIAPTVLTLLGLPAGGAMTGHALFCDASR